MVVPLITVVDLLVLSAAAIDRATWAFAPVYVGVALSYVLGGFYIFAKMLDHSDTGGDKSVRSVRR